MGNCLKTQLKQVVNNDNLELLGKFIFSVPGSKAFYIKAINPTTLTISDEYPNVTFSNNQRTATVRNDLVTFTTTGDCKIIADNKYELFFINADNNVAIGCNIDNLQYCPMTDISIASGADGNNGNILGHVSKLPTSLVNMNLRSIGISYDSFPSLPNLKNYCLIADKPISINDIVNKCPALILIEGYYGELTGNIDTLPTRTNLTELVFNMYGNKYHSISGDIRHLGSWTGLITLNLYGATRVEGTLESFCDAQKSSRQSGDTIAFTGNGVVTYQGTAIARGTAKTITFDGGGGYSVS